MEKTSFPDSRIDGQVVLVTGASRGLGRWIAAGMAHAGARVVLVSRSLEGSENAAEEIARQGADVLPLEADVADAGAAVAMVQQTIAHFGRIDCLVNNAGINVHKPMLEITPEDFDLVSSVNFRGVYFTSQAAARQMIDQGGGGRIINISSSAGVLLRPQIPNSVYAGTKAAVIMLTKAFAEELAPHNINVNAVAPGYFATPLSNDRLNDPEIRQKILSMTPLRQIGGPGDIIGPVIFLASGASRFMTGQTIFVDGGRTII